MVFTKQEFAMLSSVLKSDRAITLNIKNRNVLARNEAISLLKLRLPQKVKKLSSQRQKQ